MNSWKIATFVLIVLALAGLSLELYQEKTTYYDFGDDFKILKTDLNALSDAMNENPFWVCSMKTNDCVEINRIE
jgi:hypothetical protein